MTAPDAATPDDTRSPDEIERDLERTREQLGDTVEALTDHLDVKRRTKDWADRTTQRARHRTQELVDTRGRELAAAGAAVLVALVAVAVWGARRR